MGQENPVGIGGNLQLILVPPAEMSRIPSRGHREATGAQHGREHERLHRRWIESGRRHAGIIIARRHVPGGLAVRLGRLIGRLTAGDFTNQLFYA